MSKTKALVTCEISAEALAYLKAQPHLQVEFSQGLQPTAEELKGVKAILTRSGTKLHRDLLNRHSELEFIVTATSGFDHIDLNTCHEHDINVCNCPGANTESAAQLTLAMILNSLRRVPQLHQIVLKNQWRQKSHRGLELTERQLGVVGFGRVGSRVAELAKAFHMDVVVHDPYVDVESVSACGHEPMGLIELFKTSDVVSFHVPLTTETRHMVNHRTLAHFNPEAFIINASRGAVIDETELAVRMREGLFSGAALDVFEKEPLAKESPLRDVDRVLFSPHIGAYTEQAFQRASMEAATKLSDYFKQGQVQDELPPQTEWAKHLIENT